ncbi:MAG: ABC transporter permease [Alphaproteobacteria bacterium]|nr:ABC transporter permease [Alphaproteobacteria bacterium]
MPPSSAADETGLASASIRRKASRSVVVGLQILTFIALMALWQVLSAAKILDPFFFSRPSDIALRIGDWVITGFIWEHLAVTLIEALLALAIGTLFGVVLGLAFARLELLAAVFDPYIRIFNALPRLILAPIFLLWFGLGIASKVALGVTLVFFVVFFNTYRGVREVDPVILNNARMLQATDRQLLRHVYLPSAMAWIFSSLHTSIGFALVGAVVGEYMGAARGIGYVVAQAEGVFDTTGVFAGLILTSAVVLLIDLGIERLERYLLRWRPQH